MRAWKLTMNTSSIGQLFILLFKSRRTLCHVTKCDASCVLQTYREHQKWLCGHLRNLITLSQLKIIQCCLALLCDYEWVINMWNFSCKNSERLLRKWQKTLRDTFFAEHCILLLLLQLKTIETWVMGSTDPTFLRGVKECCLLSRF